MIWILSIMMIIGIIIFLDTWRGIQTVLPLSAVEPLANDEKVSVIIAARNEEKSVEMTMLSLLNQTHSELELIVVNDRSTDATGLIINKLARRHERMVPIHIETLPSGWLGKNHALYKGYQVASGSFLLFADADIHFEKDTISKALTYMKAQTVDHVTIAPDLQAKGFWLQAFISYFLYGFSVFKRPWTANHDHSRKGGMGIGAFNLIKRDVYEQIGTHEGIKNRPDDDLKLGQVIKQNGYKQRFLSGVNQLWVEWYPSLKEAIKGLEKNTFAGFNYSLAVTVFAITTILISHFLPIFTLFSTDYAVQLLSAIFLIIFLALYGVTIVKMSSYSLWKLVVYPITTTIFLYSTIRAVALTYIKGGIEWRGTFYSLKELRGKQHQ
ncbi:glycosyltransferase [Pseudoneobacillus rhizosphaerae]|uniref:4,4'-diaponeurosporenoate glycosyltransferase n=1 Tax=Pseudoneobacillus rhizosphaerae TaxID=2880968 RepID=A0A9C7GD49_9BACI|nr:glycosyltransferase [Pseudoneobacillus rhizosphaerae]CAG9609905.1 4,4'-diaponeurosporenoate glycosyltransferase [Pseudoneobacillus rhizosphaerae]